jgi:predicted ATPase
MRLLFIYFYENFGTFEKGSIIHLSKKYKFTLEKENPTENEFYFNKEENPNFIEDFYFKNIDIGVLIGENGTGKSVLLNSIRDKKNDYSICVYEEENNEFYLLENDLFKIKENEYYERNNIPFEENENFIIKIDDKKISKKRNLKSIYYSSILEKINENLNDDFDISNMYLLNEINENNLEKKLELLEINDLHKMSKFKYNIRTDISKTFFEDAKEFIKDSYILLFERTMDKIRNKNDSEKFEQIYHQLSDFIRKDILKFYFDEEKLHINEFKNDEALANEYLEKYEKDFESFFVIHNVDKNEIFAKVEERMKVYKNQLFNDKFIDELLKIDFNISEKSNEEIKIFLDEIKELFKISHSPFKNKDEERIFMYFNIKKILETCLEIIEFKTSNIKQIKKIFNLYKIYYLSLEFGILDEFIKKLFMENKINDLLLFNKKVVHHKFSKTNQELIDYKQKSINEIKQIIENNYSLFYDEVINDLENLDDEILKLLILKKVEKFIRENEDKKDVNYKAIYVYLSHLLKNKSFEKDDKGFLYKDLKDERDFKFELLVLYNKKCPDITISSTFKEKDFDKYNEFIKDTIHPFSFTYNPPISSGQKAKEIINARINDAIQKINEENPNENILILLDEADLKLHLEWQRVFISDLIIKFLKKDYPNNKFYVLYATHSPMILSDITNDRVVFLKKKDDKYSEDKQDFTKSTFGANIYDIYSDSFFVDDFMGKFAKNKINEVIKIIDEYKEKKEKNPDEFMPNEKALDNLKIVKNIGEPLLRNKLEDEIKFLVKDDIMEIVNNLKGKKNEEIEKELENYSQFTQTKVLMKLLEIRK